MDKKTILIELKQLLTDQEEVDLMSFYQALPLTYRGVFTDVGVDEATLLVQPPDSVCLTWDARVYILGPEPIDLLQADVLSFDIVSGTARLGNFHYGDPYLGKRMITRVIPLEHLKVEIKTVDAELSAEMLDISSQGVGIKLAAGADDVPLQKGQEVQIMMYFPDSQVPAKGYAQAVVSSKKEQHISVVFDESKMDIRPVWNYISHRRMEILQELQEKYLAEYMKASNK